MICKTPTHPPGSTTGYTGSLLTMTESCHGCGPSLHWCQVSLTQSAGDCLHSTER